MTVRVGSPKLDDLLDELLKDVIVYQAKALIGGTPSLINRPSVSSGDMRFNKPRARLRIRKYIKDVVVGALNEAE